ncbi:MAG: thioesterase family protein [Bryobacteraceae bacterium]
MLRIEPGVSAESRILVTHEVAVDFMGNEDARILGTPYLIGYLELTARSAVKPLLDEGDDTVGTHVDVRHLAATPLGMHVRFHAVVTEVEGRRVRFRLEAFDEKEKVAEGTHERFVVTVDRFVERLKAKRSAPVS